MCFQVLSEYLFIYLFAFYFSLDVSLGVLFPVLFSTGDCKCIFCFATVMQNAFSMHYQRAAYFETWEVLKNYGKKIPDGCSFHKCQWKMFSMCLIKIY